MYKLLLEGVYKRVWPHWLIFELILRFFLNLTHMLMYGKNYGEKLSYQLSWCVMQIISALKLYNTQLNI